ncbi:hypothetical protein [Clostridium thermarum]|uniref:hypothetical protein n=1 Tax=Clostridium thermarum TaxID=1716543 RepID=UPI0015D660D1|nr:hypothetical protein [Clostridium thermarum]
MYEDFCEECQYRQGPVMEPADFRACGGYMPMQGVMPMQGTMGMTPMQNPMMQTQANINQQNIPMMQAPGQGTMMTPQGLAVEMPAQTQMQQQFQGPSIVPGATFPEAPGAPVYLDTNYMQGHLRTLIGRYVKVEFLIGVNSFIDREGVLLDVGISYIVLREAQTDDNLMCDIYSIKFVRVYY